jgi:hypothetical protein
MRLCTEYKGTVFALTPSPGWGGGDIAISFGRKIRKRVHRKNGEKCKRSKERGKIMENLSYREK